MARKKDYYKPFGRQHAKLHITHVPTGFKVDFDAYLEGFSDMYTSTWNAEDVYGRMDPIATFINTRRALSLAWNVPATSYDHAQDNLQKVNELMSFLYPLYESEAVGGATAINQSPLLRIRFANLIRTADGTKGLLGYVNGFTFDPDLEAGMFYSNTSSRMKIPGSNPNQPANEYLPKTFRLNCEFNILHEHPLGFKRVSGAGSTFSFRHPDINNAGYPYETGLEPKAQTDMHTGGDKLMNTLDDVGGGDLDAQPSTETQIQSSHAKQEQLKARTAAANVVNYSPPFGPSAWSLPTPAKKK
jgi:hypothetical protein